MFLCHCDDSFRLNTINSCNVCQKVFATVNEYTDHLKHQYAFIEPYTQRCNTVTQVQVHFPSFTSALQKHHESSEPAYVSTIDNVLIASGTVVQQQLITIVI